MGFEPTISAGERPQTYALDHTATETGFNKKLLQEIIQMGKETWVATNTLGAHIVNFRTEASNTPSHLTYGKYH